MKTKLFPIILTIALSVSMAAAQGQDRSQTSFGVLGGINFQNLSGVNHINERLDNQMLIGYHAGINIQIPLVPEFYFQPGLLFSTKGAANSVGPLESTYKLSYIEMPLNLLYKGALGNGFVLLGFGPYIGYGIMGKVKREGVGETQTYDIVFQNEIEVGDPLGTSYFKRFDAGGNIFAGYEMAGGLFFQLNTQFGLLNIYPEDKRFPVGKNKIRNIGFGLSLGYRF